MLYRKLLADIKRASRIRAEEGILSYFDEMGQTVTKGNPTFDQIEKARSEGLLELDYTTYIVK